MGIKGIYRELGAGQRISLSKLASQSFENEGRLFRLAVDIAIWQFQNQAARGGTNPAIRTLFYRLTRLLGTPIQPIFVFDGPNKPLFKRNKRSGRGDGVATAQAKRLIRLFGFAVHDAPGEAEAECALLQRQGIVDAVLSEDVDTIMFGCTRTLRNWCAEGKGSKTPTHVSLYDVEEMRMAELGLDREGMVLVALMSGGDYLPDGIPGCGVKVACEAAKAGFGKSLCRLKALDKKGLLAWKESLIHELRTNEKGYFRTKHKALSIPDGFPNLEVLRYYTHPVVSPESKIDVIRQNFNTKNEMRLEALREFTRETFDWDYRIGAIKFIRVLAQARLVDALIYHPNPESFVERIAGRRAHISTDGAVELRLSYIPQDLVPIDLSNEVDEDIAYDRDGLALNSDDEFEAPTEAMQSTQSKTPAAKIYDPSKPDTAWVLDELAQRRIPELVKDWKQDYDAKEARKAAKQSRTSKTTTVAKSTKAGGVSAGAMDQYVRVTKMSTSEVTKPAGSSGHNSKATKARSASPTKPSAPRRARTTPPLEPSKQSRPSTQLNPVRQRSGRTIGSSPMSPRTPQLPGRPEAILISSSPIGPDEADSPPAPPSARLLSAENPSQELPESVRAILAASGASKEVRRESRQFRRAKTTGDVMSTSKGFESTKSKQASMDMFTTKPHRPATNQSIPQTSSRPAQRPATSKADDLFYDSDDSFNFVPLSNLLSEPPTSPSKRHRNSPPPHAQSSSNQQSPSPKPARKKKLLVPRTSDLGFFKEIEVDADECDERFERETSELRRKGVKMSVVRLSDVSFVDLTQDDD